MFEKILVLIFILLFLGSFITRNLIVKNRIKRSIKAKDRLVNSSIVFSTLCFTVLFLSFSDQFYYRVGFISILRHPFISFIGLSLFGISIILGWLISSQLKNSWRVGVHENQKTELITSGIYAYVRNPYFLSYFIIYFSLFLVRPSILLLVLILITSFIFNRMVLKEENYLLKIHSQKYVEYRLKTGRYFPQIKKKS